jgi:CRP/FNR family cyclic AMP-dependent transcriptional regulator
VEEQFQRYVRKAAKGEFVFREGEPGHTVYVLREGHVRISRNVRGRERTFAVLGPGDFFGEMAIITGKPRNASAQAEDEVTMLELDAARFESMVQKEPNIAARIIQRLCDRLDLADQRISLLLKRDPKARVILGLMREIEERGEPGDQPETVLLRTDLLALAESLGVTELELEETMMRLSRVGLFALVPGGLRIADLPRLDEFLSFLEERGSLACGLDNVPCTNERCSALGIAEANDCARRPTDFSEQFQASAVGTLRALGLSTTRSRPVDPPPRGCLGSSAVPPSCELPLLFLPRRSDHHRAAGLLRFEPAARPRGKRPARCAGWLKGSNMTIYWSIRPMKCPLSTCRGASCRAGGDVGCGHQRSERGPTGLRFSQSASRGPPCCTTAISLLLPLVR